MEDFEIVWHQGLRSFGITVVGGIVSRRCCCHEVYCGYILLQNYCFLLSMNYAGTELYQKKNIVAYELQQYIPFQLKNHPYFKLSMDVALYYVWYNGDMKNITFESLKGLMSTLTATAASVLSPHNYCLVDKSSDVKMLHNSQGELHCEAFDKSYKLVLAHKRNFTTFIAGTDLACGSWDICWIITEFLDNLYVFSLHQQCEDFVDEQLYLESTWLFGDAALVTGNTKYSVAVNCRDMNNNTILYDFDRYLMTYFIMPFLLDTCMPIMKNTKNNSWMDDEPIGDGFVATLYDWMGANCVLLQFSLPHENIDGTFRLFNNLYEQLPRYSKMRELRSVLSVYGLYQRPIGCGAIESIEILVEGTESVIHQMFLGKSRGWN